MLPGTIGATSQSAMVRPRLFLHVGLPKCGSTSIQLRLASNRAALLERGIFYARMPVEEEGEEHVGHMPLSSSIFRSHAESPLLGAVVHDHRASGVDALCLSSEAFITRADRQRAEGVGDALDGYDASMIAFYRRHDAWITSRYKQAVFGRAYVGTLAEFVADPPRGYLGMVNFDIAERLDRLAAVFGVTRTHVVDLDAGKVDAVAEMGAFIGAPLADWPVDKGLLGDSGSLKAADGDANISLGNMTTLFLRDVNARVTDPGLRDAIIVSLIRTAEPEPPTRLMRKPMAERLRATFARVNRRLFERYGLTPHPGIQPGGGPFRDTLDRQERDSIRERLLADMNPPVRDVARTLLAA